ncbi:hypothetical protein QTP88_015558 [Uroleucon formosanum]
MIVEVFKLFGEEGGFEDDDSENGLLYDSFEGELMDTSGVTFDDEGSDSLDQSIVIFSRNSKSGVEGGRVSSICTSVVISRVLLRDIIVIYINLAAKTHYMFIAFYLDSGFEVCNFARLRNFVKEFGEDIFSCDNAVLFCKVCGVKVSAEKKYNIQQHITRDKHIQQLNIRNQQEKPKSQLLVTVDTYISKEAKFPPIIWAANIASLVLTTNACESYHSRFNSEFYHPHPTIYHFLDVLKGFQTETMIKIKSKHLKKRNSTKNKNRLETFKQIYEDYRQNKIDRKALVSSLSHK